MREKSSYAKKAKWMPLLMIPLFLLGVYMIYQRLAYEQHDFYEENFKAYPIPTRVDPAAQAGLTALKESNYAQADRELTLAFLEHPSAETGIQLAMARMADKKYWEAIDVLQEVKEKYPTYQSVAEWYKILSLIALERKEEALELLVYYCEQPDFEFMKKEAQGLLHVY